MKEAFNKKVVDLVEFSKTPCNGAMLQFLLLVNDIDSLVELNKARKQPIQEGKNFYTDRWSKGVLVFLDRHNNAAIFECLKNTVGETHSKVFDSNNTYKVTSQKNSKKGSKRLLWRQIFEDQSLRHQLENLHAYLTLPETAVIASVRNKLGAHADAEALKSGLRLVSNESFPGVLVASAGQFRAFFIDDILAEQQLQFLRDGNISSSAYIDFFERIRKELVSFTAELFHKYCSENGLYVSPEKLVQVEKTIETWDSFKFVN